MDNQEYNYTPAPQPNVAPAPQPLGGPEGKTVMVLGIVALALCELGIPGIILAAIAIHKAKQWAASYGNFTAMPRVGNILARVALPISIVMTVFWILYIAFICFMVWVALHTNTPPHAIPFDDFSTLVA